LTEGDSAKALAVSGLSVVGRDNYGVFPLRGKLLNVRDASVKQVIANEEISAINQILGLTPGKVYDSTKELRYGHLMIMADQDHDGSHIKGLVVNFIHNFWPSLLKIPGFMMEFITPIVKASKGKQTLSFYNLPEYEHWREENGGGKGWKIKYYKGLGTSTAAEARDYFSDLTTHKKEFKYTGPQDDESITLAFAKNKADDRKEWLRNYVPGTHLNHKMPKIPYNEFINKELILFSMADCVRSIPSVLDGFKPGQRKILFCCFKRNLKNEIRVAQLAGYVSEHSAYHHGEASLHSTIVGLAQNFVGSNNVNFLDPVGQFGTRIGGGKDAASARYIHTCLAPLTRHVFHPDDDNILTYLEEDGQQIEPQYYMPILPLVLVNGNEGIGTGWSSSIPNYNPREIVENLRRKIKGEPVEPMHPWFRGFSGSLEWDGSKSNYRIKGVWKRIDDETLEVTELPIRVWTQKYKEFLEKSLEGAEPAAKAAPGKKTAAAAAKKTAVPKRKKKNDDDDDDDVPAAAEPEVKTEPALITSYKEYHTDTRVHFVIKSNRIAGMSDDEIEKKFKLSTAVSISNMHLFDSQGRIKKYATPEEILEEFYDMRLQYYQMRKDYLVDQMQRDYKILENKVRFIMAVINKELSVSNRKRAELLSELVAKKYDAFPKKKVKKVKTEEGEVVKAEEAEEPAEGDDQEDDKDERSRNYDYLLSMAIWSLTMERVNKMKQQLAEKKQELEALLETKPTDMWLRDLDNFDQSWDSFETAMGKLDAEGGQGKNVKKMKLPTVSTAPKKKAVKQEYSDEEDDFDEKKPAPKKRKEPTPAVKAESKPAKAAASAKQSTLGFKTEKKADSDDEFGSPPASKKLKTETSAVAAPKSPATNTAMSLFARVKAMQAQKLASPTPTVTASKPPAKSSISRMLDSDDEEVASGPTLAAAKPKRETARKTFSEFKDSDDDAMDVDGSDDFGGADDDDDDDDDILDFDSPEKPKKPAPKKAAAVKKAPAKKIADSDDDDVVAVKPKPVAKAAAVAKPAAKPKPKKKVDSEEEDSDDVMGGDSDDDDDMEIVSKRDAPRPGRRAATSKPKYAVDSEDDDFDDDD
jgi:DNA topoisomerase II